MANLRLLLCAVALGIGVSVGQDFPVPDTILLPDSLGSLHPRYHLAFGSSTDNIYVASESSDIIVVDGNTFQRIKRINTGTPVGGALLVSQHNKLYCSYPLQGRIGVIDCATNSIVGSIKVGTRPKLLCYSSGSDKLYCGDTIDQTVTVIDCGTDTVRKVVSVGKGLTAMVYDPTTNKVYAATRDALLAVSCGADSVVAAISAIKDAGGLCISKRRQKLYAALPQRRDTLFVVSTTTDTVTAALQCTGSFSTLLACNEATDRLYGITVFDPPVYVEEFDCVGDTWIRGDYVGDYLDPPVGLACDAVHDRLYYLFTCNGYGNLMVIDCATLDFVSCTPLGQQYSNALLESDPARYRLMCAGGYEEGIMAAFDYKGDSLCVRGAVPLSGWQWRSRYNPLCQNLVEGKMYYRWGAGVGGLAVVDEQTNGVVAQALMPQEWGSADLAYSRTSNEVYFGARNGLGVMDGSADTLLRVIAVDGAQSFCWCPDDDKVYCYADLRPRFYIAAVDCPTDSVVREIDVYDVVDGMQYLGNHRLLCWTFDRLMLIDCRTDSVLVDTAYGGNIYEVSHSGDGQKIYIVHSYRLEVLDASSLALLTSIDWYSIYANSYWLACCDSTNKLYWFTRYTFGTEHDSALVIDTRSDSVVARLAAGFDQPRSGCLDHSGRYLFRPDPHYNNSLIVYDTQRDSVAGIYTGLPCPLQVASNPEQHRIYVGCPDVILVYPDVPPGVEETPNSEERATKSGPTVVRGMLLLAGSPSSSPSTSCLLDAAGRKVMELRAGANDVSRLSPGVYFVREEPQASSPKPQAVRKIILTE